MARLVGLPERIDQLIVKYQQNHAGQRLGQYVWNKYGVAGVDGKTDSELFYATYQDALNLIKTRYYAG